MIFFIDLSGIVGWISFLLTLTLLIYQIFKNRKLKIYQNEWINALISRSHAGYNYFYRIGICCDRSRMNRKDNAIIMENIQTITGIADAARLDIISYCRTHLNNYVPFFEHPASPRSSSDGSQNITTSTADPRG
jgi:hypothetical protein